MKVVISRHWHHPHIACTVNDDGIILETDLEDVIRGLIAEIGNPTLLITRGQMQKRALAALPIVIGKIKEASTKAIL